MRKTLRALGALLLLGFHAAGDGARASERCTYAILTSGVAVTASGSPQPCHLNQSTQYWTAVAVRSAPGDNWDLEVGQSQAASPTCVSGSLATSARTTGVDLVVGDFNPGHNPLATYYPRVARASGSGNAAVEWDDGADALTVNGPLVNRTTGATDVIEVWDVFLAAGSTYAFTFTPTGANLKLMLFQSGAGVYWAGRNGALFEVAGSTDFAPPSSGFYGVVVVNDDGASGAYSLGVGRCEAPAPLTSGVAASTGGLAERYYSIDQNASFWTAVGARGSADWNLELFTTGSGGPYPACFADQVAGSSSAPGAVDFVVGNFNLMIPVPLFVRVHMNQSQGSGSAMVEWDDGGTLADIIVVDAPTISRATGPSDVLECWDVYLDAGTTYQFFFHSAGAGPKLFLFSSGLDWGGRSSAMLQLGGSPVAVPYTATQTGWHGLVFVNEDGLPGSYDLRVYRSGVVAAGDGPGDGPAPHTRLQGIAPNPSRGALQIRFALHEASPVAFEVMDVAGRVVSEVPARQWPQGVWTTSWSGLARGGARLSAGVYFLRMRASGRAVALKKFTLLD